MLPELAAVAATAGWAATTGYAAHLHRQLHTDELTGLGNRRALYRLARRAARRPRLVGLLLADLDGFKAINDTYGHPFGNRILAMVGTRLAEISRPGETAIHLHGDEFALWLGRLTGPTDVEQRARDVTTALATPLWIDGHRITTSASVGLALGPACAPLAELLRAADTHLYAVKAARHAALPTLPTTPGRIRDQRPPAGAA
ncbi:hypothetical protein GCM10012275_02580 [Longimycelium tulufanense]|uniref:GGDEF domain-containing protein n=1 Tax=Longimycelium tulufanense TaxID=907463 RepID=A0A8J3CA02_9PSEU|nr:GGDEF domain-containing protein [Longimycelium tulufanense]GGM34819.1 hypothetical protein GCM10012275_02580 [Longimycelium tulufanense]